MNFATMVYNNSCNNNNNNNNNSSSSSSSSSYLSLSTALKQSRDLEAQLYIFKFTIFDTPITYLLLP